MPDITTDKMPTLFSERDALLQTMHYREIALPSDGPVCALDEGEGTAIVLLHGIGSTSASWVKQIAALSRTYRIIAWDAPGYGWSARLPLDQPKAADYAKHLLKMLDGMGVARCILVGHSLGALVAGAFAALGTETADRVMGMLLLSPARGYGSASASVRHDKLASRLAVLDRLGIDGMARERAAAMLSSQASPAHLQWIQATMASLNVDGYRQAAHMLANGDLLGDLSAIQARAKTDFVIRVAVGDHDGITPPAACETVAAAANCELAMISGAGHACHVERDEQVTSLIRDFAAYCLTTH